MIQLKDIEHIVARNKYGLYCVPASFKGLPGAREILASEVYEPLTIEYMLRNCGDGDIVQAGAFFGDFIPALALNCAKTTKIWAFEPHPISYTAAVETCRLNSIRNTALLNTGLSNRSEFATMQISSDKVLLGGGSSITNRCQPGGTVCTIKTCTLDTVIPATRNVTILQLDVEGHELEALEGAGQLIARCHPIVIVEVLPGSLLLQRDQFKTLLSGYKPHGQIYRNHVFKPS